MAHASGLNQRQTAMRTTAATAAMTSASDPDPATALPAAEQDHYFSLGHRCNKSKRRARAVTDFSIDAIIGARPASEPNALVSTSAPTKLEPPAGNDVMSGQLATASRLAARHSDDPAPGQDSPRAKKYRPKNFQCPACKMAFSNNGQLKNHIRIHTGERPFVCDVADCKKTFTRNEELTRHKLIHTGIRPHACTHCGKRFGRKDHLKKHVRTHERKKLRKRVFVPAAAAAAAAAAVAAATSQTHRAAAIDSIVFASQQAKSNPNHAIKAIRGVSAPQRPLPAPHQQQQQQMLLPPNPFLAPSALGGLPAEPPVCGFDPTLGSTSFTSCLPPLPCLPSVTSTTFDPSTIHRAAAAAAVNLAAAAAVVTSTSTNSSSSATLSSPTTNLQLLANDYWNKWYNILGQYHQQTCPSRTENGSNSGGQLR